MNGTGFMVDQLLIAVVHAMPFHEAHREMGKNGKSWTRLAIRGGHIEISLLFRDKARVGTGNSGHSPKMRKRGEKTRMHKLGASKMVDEHYLATD